MAQSSDFRLTFTDADGKRDVDSDTAQKQFVLTYPKWSGLLCYTGIARHYEHDTATWLENLLVHSPDERRNPEDIVRLLKREGNWLRAIAPEDRRTTFTMIAYDKNSIPRIWVISNFERPDQPQKEKGEDNLFCTRIRAGHPRNVITGWPKAVLPEQRQALLDLISRNPDRDDLSDAVAITNRDAAPRAKRSANDAEEVSKECVVATLSPDGSGQIVVYGDLPKEFLPCIIQCGKNVPALGQMKENAKGKMLDSVSWPAKKYLSIGVMGAVCMRVRYPVGFKWPDDPNAPPRFQAPVEFTMEPNDQAPPGSKPTKVEWFHREGLP